MTEPIIDWGIRLASWFDAEPGVREITVTFNDGGSMVVDDRGPRFVTHGLTLDVEDALGREAFEVVPR